MKGYVVFGCGTLLCKGFSFKQEEVDGKKMLLMKVVFDGHVGDKLGWLDFKGTWWLCGGVCSMRGV